MKYTTKETLENTRPSQNMFRTIDFCLNQLYKDTEKKVSDEVCDRLTYEELIGSLLSTRDTVEKLCSER